MDSHYLIFISSYYTINIHTLSLPTFGLTRAVEDLVDPRNCVDSQGWVVLYLPTLSLRSWRQNWSRLWILFGCREMCDGVVIVCSLPSRCIVSPLWPPSRAYQSSLTGRVQVLLQSCSTSICGQIVRMYIYRETYIIHAISWCSKSCYCNNDKYVQTKCLVVI